MTILERLLALYFRSGLRGSTRLTDIIASRLTRLHDVVIRANGGELHLDLRVGSARGILAYPESRTGEDKVIGRLVRAGDVVLDIGAHLGFYTLLLSRKVGAGGKVFAFEPNPTVLPSLVKSVSTVSNINLLQLGLADKAGDVELFIPEDASMSSLHDWTNGTAGTVDVVKIPIATLDELYESGAIPLPQFIKCDIEGAELSVFKGAQEMLDRQDAPVLMFELNRPASVAFGSTPSDCLEFLRSLQEPKYSFFQVSADGIESLQTSNLDFANVLAIPVQRLGEVGFSG
ncbi:MAG: FkbM family methyltransferase [Acidobacteria bacterium]|nr:FkbM family methyltransferase [Acidobacteriota bacterium]MCW5948145.1 FkbM family methyltransferase [Pyrinomonadaceae bacterium]